MSRVVLISPITAKHSLSNADVILTSFLAVLFGGAGSLAYLTFGNEIQTVVLVNLNMHSKMVQSVCPVQRKRIHLD